MLGRAVTDTPKGSGEVICSAAIKLNTTGTTRAHGVQSLLDVLRCLVEQIVQFNLHVRSFFWHR